MPTVPYSPVPTERASDQGVPSINVNARPEAFGSSIGTALGHLGQVAEHAGDELFGRAVALQQLNNESEAKEADADYMVKAGKLHAEYGALEGKAAVDAYPGYVKDLQETRKSMRAGLSNDMARRMYDSASLSTMGRTIFNGAGHAATQQKVYATGASQARIDAIDDYALHNPRDDQAFQSGLDTAEREIRDTQAPIAGWSPEKTDEVVAKSKSKLISSRITGLSRTAPFQAKELLEANRAELHGADLDRVDKIVQGQMRTVGARNISDEINADLKEDPQGSKKSLQARLEEGRVKADKIAPDDPTFKDYVDYRITADVSHAKTVQKDFDQENAQTINKALIGGPDGKLPTTVEELTSTPETQVAWDQLKPSVQRGFLAALTRNAKGDSAWNGESLKRYQTLKGQAQSDPEQFLGANVIDEKMPNSAKRELINLQVRLKDKAEGDPRVTHALQILRPTMQSAGIDATKDKDQYYQFVGSLQDALDQYQKDNKKLPNAEEVNTIGSRLLQQSVVKEGWLWNSKEPVFSASPPEPVANRIRNDPFWKSRGIEPTDADIQRIYAREQYQKLYGGSAKPSVPK